MGLFSNDGAGREAREEGAELVDKHGGFEENRQTQIARYLNSADSHLASMAGIKSPDVIFGSDKNAANRAGPRNTEVQYAHTADTIAPNWRESGQIPHWIDRRYIDDAHVGSAEERADKQAEAAAADAKNVRAENIWRAYLPKSHPGHVDFKEGEEITYDEVTQYKEGDNLYEEVWSLWYRGAGRDSLDNPHGGTYMNHFEADWMKGNGDQSYKTPAEKERERLRL